MALQIEHGISDDALFRVSGSSGGIVVQNSREPRMQFSLAAGQEAVNLLFHSIPTACSLSHDSPCLNAQAVTEYLSVAGITALRTQHMGLSLILLHVVLCEDVNRRVQGVLKGQLPQESMQSMLAIVTVCPVFR